MPCSTHCIITLHALRDLHLCKSSQLVIAMPWPDGMRAGPCTYSSCARKCMTVMVCSAHHSMDASCLLSLSSRMWCRDRTHVTPGACVAICTLLLSVVSRLRLLCGAGWCCQTDGQKGAGQVFQWAEHGLCPPRPTLGCKGPQVAVATLACLSSVAPSFCMGVSALCISCSRKQNLNIAVISWVAWSACYALGCGSSYTNITAQRLSSEANFQCACQQSAPLAPAVCPKAPSCSAVFKPVCCLCLLPGASRPNFCPMQNIS